VARSGRPLEIGQVPPPVKRASQVVVPGAGMSRLTAEGISAALSLGDDVIAVTVVFTDPDDELPADVSFRDQWNAWRPEVPLITLRSAHRSIVLIPEVQPSSPWQWLLHNQRGLILDHAIRHGTENVVLCRLRYRLDTLAADTASTSGVPRTPDTPCASASQSLSGYRPITSGTSPAG
jgi:hypothetical protein